MTTLFYADPELVIGLHRTIIFVNPNDLQIFKSVELPESLQVETSKEKLAETTECESKDKEITSVKEPLKIQQVSYATNRTLLAVTTSGQKCLLLYKCRPEYAWLVSTRALSRTSSALIFSSDSEHVLVTDKTGDCYLYDCVNMEAPPKLLLGHLSIVNDVIWSENKKFIITCDRDDKIRVTNYPETYDIHGYCLGHKEFVSGLKFLSNNTIVSISGDKTLRVWNYVDCKELMKVELPGAASRFDIRHIDDSSYEAAILHSLDDCVSMFSLKKQNNGEWEAKELEVYKLDKFAASNLCLADGRLYVSGAVNGKFTLKLISISSALPPPENWMNIVEDQFKEYSWTLEDITLWFKKRYDNVSDYLERKRRRIEEKQK